MVRTFLARAACILIAIAAVEAQNPPPPPAQAAPAAFMCPMHPDVVTTEPGKCPRCNMDLVPGTPLALPDFKLKVETMPRVLRAGQPIRLLLRAPSDHG
jgi:hypothetical protein